MSRRAYQVDRELLLLAYERVTPPVTAKQDEQRAKLLAMARAILTNPQPLPAAEEQRGPGLTRSRGSQLPLKGVHG